MENRQLAEQLEEWVKKHPRKAAQMAKKKKAKRRNLSKDLEALATQLEARKRVRSGRRNSPKSAAAIAVQLEARKRIRSGRRNAPYGWYVGMDATHRVYSKAGNGPSESWIQAWGPMEEGRAAALVRKLRDKVKEGAFYNPRPTRSRASAPVKKKRKKKNPGAPAWYVGVDSGNRKSIFFHEIAPTKRTHGGFYDFVVGPFPTQSAAKSRSRRI